MEELKKGTCILVCAGDYRGERIQKGPEDFVMAVDAGLGHLIRAGMMPDYILGDFDSLRREDFPFLDRWQRERPEALTRLPHIKDDTDTVAAVKLGLRLGYRRFRIYGGLGGRLDHTLSNIQTLAYLKRHGGHGTLAGRGQLVMVLEHEQIRIDRGFEGLFSLFALDEQVTGITLKGMDYELENGSLVNTFPLGQSNEIHADRQALAAVDKGLALVILGGKRGSCAVFLFILLGAVGIPVFSGFRGGLGHLIGPTGGYLIGFLCTGMAHILLQKCMERLRTQLRIALLMAEHCLCYLFGTLWFVAVFHSRGTHYGFFAALGLCVLPYVLPDLVKIALAELVSRRVRPLLPR